MSDYLPGAVQVPQPGGGVLNRALPARAVWHITWDALNAAGGQPQFSAVSNYLRTQGYCPHIMWNPFTGYVEQYYPASQSARALAAWNEDGAACVQIEIFFTPGCIVDGKKYMTVAETPLKGLDTILQWLDSLGIPRQWPLGSPQWSGNSRDAATWNARGGHYGHCNVPNNTHTDPGPMPDITGTTTTTQEDELSAEFERDVRAQLAKDDAEDSKFQRDVRAQLAQDDAEAASFDRDVRADLAQKGRQITALTATVDTLAGIVGREQGLDVEQVEQAVTRAIAAGLKITVEAGAGA